MTPGTGVLPGTSAVGATGSSLSPAKALFFMIFLCVLYVLCGDEGGETLGGDPPDTSTSLPYDLPLCSLGL